MSGGHFVGFFLALLGLAVLVVVSTRPVVIQRLGTKRWPSVAVAIVVLVLVALFGSGSREIFFRTVVGPRDGVITRVTQAHVDVALEEITRPTFVQYMVRLEAAPPVDESERLARALSVRVGTTVDLLAEGVRLDPPPKIGQPWFFVSYLDRENALWAIFRGDAGVQTMALAERLVTRVLPQAAAIVALRMAATEDEKMALLRENPFVMPYAAEWIASELEKLATKASPALRVELEQKRAYVQQYVNDPGARDLPPGPRVDAP